jgi:biotin synthase-like enzyme
MNELIGAVKGLGMQTCATLGMLQPHQAASLRDAGLDYYNHNLDTAPEYYKDVVSTRQYQDGWTRWRPCAMRASACAAAASSAWARPRSTVPA